MKVNRRDIESPLCPKDLAQVTADHNTVQLRLIVPDINQVYELALRTGGTPSTEVEEVDGALHTSCLRHPDGNSIKSIQGRKI